MGFFSIYLVRSYCTRTKLNTRSHINILLNGTERDRELLRLEQCSSSWLCRVHLLYCCFRVLLRTKTNDSTDRETDLEAADCSEATMVEEHSLVEEASDLVRWCADWFAYSADVVEGEATNVSSVENSFDDCANDFELLLEREWWW